MNPDDITSVSAAIKKLYREQFGKIKTSPLDVTSSKTTEQLFVNLSLIDNINIHNNKDIHYERFVWRLANESGKTRIVFIGEAGAGKTTLLRKIAYDWATGKHLNDIDILLYVPLRELPKCASLNNIYNTYTSRGIEINSEKMEEFMKANQKRVVLLLDGLDEYDGEITGTESSTDFVSIMRGDDLKYTPVIITTRPWRADQVTSDSRVSRRYSRMLVKGFKETDVREYIEKYFYKDTESANSLIHLVTEDSLVTENMAPYPIFCCMLCNMWKEVSRREIIQTLQTFSQLFEEMVSSLTEHWVSKRSFRDYRKRCRESFKQIGKVAFDGLLSKRLVFTERSFEACMDSMKTGCEIGVLSSDSSFASMGNEPKVEESYISFPHKLFQEYLAGLYFASLHIDDPAQFSTLLWEKILTDYQEHRYLLYFTAAHGKDLGNTGKAVMDSICMEIKDEAFIMDVAFECNDKKAISPVTQYLRNKCQQFCLSERIQILQKHAWSGYMYTFAVCAMEMVSELV